MIEDSVGEERAIPRIAWLVVLNFVVLAKLLRTPKIGLDQMIATTSISNDSLHQNRLFSASQSMLRAL